MQKISNKTSSPNNLEGKAVAQFVWYNPRKSLKIKNILKKYFF